MTPETLETVKTFLPYVVATITAVWLFWRKNYDDNRENRQREEKNKLDHLLKQDIFTADQLSELTQKLISYFLEDDSVKRDEILEFARQTATRDQIKSLEYKLTALDDKFRLLVGTIAEVYDSVKKRDE